MGVSAGLRASATINRHDFSLGQGAGVQFAASSMVTIEIDLASDPGCWLLTAEDRDIAHGKLVEAGRSPPENRLDDR